MQTLLSEHDPAPVCSLRSDARSRFVMIGDHAGAAIPAALGDMGVSATDRTRHIAIDLGIEAIGRALSDRLDAPFLWQSYSRLVFDCNRAADNPQATPAVSDGTPIPANRDLSEDGRRARQTAIYDPYHDAISSALDERGADTVLVALHSFTPSMDGFDRPWEFGVLHDGHEDAFAMRVLAELRKTGRTIGDNEPYRMDEIDYTIPRHAFARGLSYVELEVRQDIAVSQKDAVVDILADCLTAALDPSERITT